MSKLLYFYTDPLAAAWMAKHHGMRFEGLFPATAQTREVTLPAIESHIGLGHLQIDGRFYIHADSMLLLKPKSGDLVRVMGEIGYVPSTAGFAALYAQRLAEANCQPHATGRIIQRDGTAFHWPESEAA